MERGEGEKGEEEREGNGRGTRASTLPSFSFVEIDRVQGREYILLIALQTWYKKEEERDIGGNRVGSLIFLKFRAICAGKNRLKRDYERGIFNKVTEQKGNESTK